MARQCLARFGMVWHGTARHSRAWQGFDLFVFARRGRSSLGRAMLRKAGRGMAGSGVSRLGVASRGLARLGLAMHGSAWHAGAWRGGAWQGLAMRRKAWFFFKRRELGMKGAILVGVITTAGFLNGAAVLYLLYVFVRALVRTFV